MGGFALGWQAAHDKNVDKRQRKQALGDEERKLKVTDLYQRGNDLAKLIPSMSGAEKDKAMQSLADIEQNIQSIYHPDNNPGAVQKDWHFLAGLVTGKRTPLLAPQAPAPAPAAPVGTLAISDIELPEQSTQVPATPTEIKTGYRDPKTGQMRVKTTAAPTMPAIASGTPKTVIPGGTGTKVAGPPAPHVSEAMAVPQSQVAGLIAPGNISIWNRKVVNNGDGTHSTEFSTSFTDEREDSPYYGKEVIVPTVVNGKFLTPDGTKPPPGSPAEHAMMEKARKYYEQTGQHLGVFDNPANADKYAGLLHTRGERKRPDASHYKPTAAQLKVQAHQDDARKQAESLVASQGTPEQQEQVESRKNLAHITQARKDFKIAYPNATPEQEATFMGDLIAKQYGFTQRPNYKEFLDPDGKKTWLDVTQPIPPGYTATGAENTDTRKRADYAAYQKEHPDYKGTFEQWVVEQGQYARRAVPTGRDDRFIDIEQRRAQGQPISDDDQAYAGAYNLYIQKRVIDPGVARAAAFANNRYVQVMDPKDPSRVTFMKAQDAAMQGAGSPASISFQTDKAMNKYMTSGLGGQNIASFNTAVSHLALFSEAAEALNNGDIQAANRIGNYLGVQFGDDAVTNFNAVKSAVAGEVANVFKKSGATDTEIAQINEVLSSSESPEQIRGAISYYTRLMGGKLDALKAQFQMGSQGQPAFVGGGGKTVRMRAPDGVSMKDVPPDQVQWYKDHGATEVEQR